MYIKCIDCLEFEFFFFGGQNNRKLSLICKNVYKQDTFQNQGSSQLSYRYSRNLHQGIPCVQQVLILYHQAASKFKDHLQMGLKVLKVESIPHVPDCPRRDCPPLQLLLVEFQLHLLKGDKKICSHVVALLSSAFEHSPHVSCQWALPQDVTHHFRLMMANFTVWLNSYPSPVEIVSSWEAI